LVNDMLLCNQKGFANFSPDKLIKAIFNCLFFNDFFLVLKAQWNHANPSLALFVKREKRRR
jgi:hypothetical protein